MTSYIKICYQPVVSEKPRQSSNQLVRYFFQSTVDPLAFLLALMMKHFFLSPSRILEYPSPYPRGKESCRKESPSFSNFLPIFPWNPIVLRIKQSKRFVCQREKELKCLILRLIQATRLLASRDTVPFGRLTRSNTSVLLSRETLPAVACVCHILRSFYG